MDCKTYFSNMLPVNGMTDSVVRRYHVVDGMTSSQVTLKPRDLRDLSVTLLHHLKHVRRVVGTAGFLGCICESWAVRQHIDVESSSELKLACLDLAVDSAHIMELMLLSKLFQQNGHSASAMYSERKHNNVRCSPNGMQTSLANSKHKTSEICMMDASCETTIVKMANKSTQTNLDAIVPSKVKQQKRPLRNGMILEELQCKDSEVQVKADNNKSNSECGFKAGKAQQQLNSFDDRLSNNRKRKSSLDLDCLPDVIAGSYDVPNRSTKCFSRSFTNSVLCSSSRQPKSCKTFVERNTRTYKPVLNASSASKWPRQQRYSKRLLATSSKGQLKPTTVAPNHLQKLNKQKSCRAVQLLSLRKHLSPLSHQPNVLNTRSEVLDHLDEILDCVAHNVPNMSPVPCHDNEAPVKHKRKQVCPLRANVSNQMPLELRRLDIAMCSQVQSHVSDRHTATSMHTDGSKPQQRDSSKRGDLTDCRVIVKRLSGGNCLHNKRLRSRWQDRHKSNKGLRNSLLVRQHLTDCSSEKRVSVKLSESDMTDNNAEIAASNGYLKSVVKLAASAKHLDNDDRNCIEMPSAQACIPAKTFKSDVKSKHSVPTRSVTKRKQPSSSIKKVDLNKQSVVTGCKMGEQSENGQFDSQNLPVLNNEVRNNCSAALFVDVSVSLDSSTSSPCSPLPEPAHRARERRCQENLLIVKKRAPASNG
jgi:hypothetical protein